MRRLLFLALLHLQALPMSRSLSDSHLEDVMPYRAQLREIPRIVVTEPDDIEIGRPRASSDLSQLPEQVQHEIFQWAINELMESNQENERNARKWKIVAGIAGGFTTVATCIVALRDLICVFE